MRSSNQDTAWARAGEMVSRRIRSTQAYCRGIQAKLIGLFLFLSLLPLAIAGGLAFQSARASLETSIGVQLEIRALRILNEVEQTLADGQSSLQNWVKLPVMHELVGDDPDRRITRTLITLANESSSLGQLLAISPLGYIVAASEPRRIGERVAEQPWFLRLRDQDAVAEHPAKFMLMPEGNQFYFGVPVRSQAKGHSVIGYLATVLTRERLDEILKATNSEHSLDYTDVYLLDREGRALVRHIRQIQGPVSEDESSRLSRFLQYRLYASHAEHNNGWSVWPSDRGEQLTGYSRSRLEPTAGATVVVLQSTELAFAPVHELRNMIVIVGIALFFLVLVLSRIVAARLCRPINILTMNAEAVAAGRFTVANLPLSRGDEIGSLARAFTRMTQELRVLTGQLEERVRERTSALDDTNRSLQKQILEREAAEAAVRAGERRFQQMVSQVRDYAIIMLDPQGLVIEWNDGAQRVKGYKADEIIGRHFSCFYFDEDVKAGKPVQLLAQAAGRGSIENTGWRVRQDGSRFWAYTVMTAIHDELGSQIGFSELTRDLSMQQAAEAEKISLESQLQQAQKMEAIGRLAGGIAHDFNNLLTVITGYCQIASTTLHPNQPLFLPIQEIGKAADRAASLTMQLLAFSRKQVLQPTVLRLNEVVAEMDDLLRPLIGEDIQLGFVYAGDLEPVRVDRSQLDQIVMNLAINARDAMPQGGRLMIRTGKVEFTAERPEATRIVPNGSYVTLEVCDTGCGMDATTKARAFEPFFTTKGPGKGTGLGLSTVYGIVKQSGGYVTIVSEPGQGASVTVYLLPTDNVPNSAAPAEAAQPESAVQAVGATILLVEDEGGIRRLLQGLLTSKGYTVLTAPDGEAGLVVGHSYSGTIDLLVTDVVMPKLNGADMAKRLMEKHADLKVLYMSGYTDESIVQHGVLESGIAFLSKPFKPQALLDRVRQVLAA